MATLTMRQQTTKVVLEERESFWEKIGGFFSMVALEVQPYFGPVSLDFLHQKYRASLSAKENAEIDAYLHSLI